VGVGVSVSKIAGVDVGEGVVEDEGVGDGEVVDEGVGVGDGVGVGVGDGVRVEVGVGDGEGVDEGVGDGEGVDVGVGDGEGVEEGVGVDALIQSCENDITKLSAVPKPGVQTPVLFWAPRNRVVLSIETYEKLFWGLVIVLVPVSSMVTKYIVFEIKVTGGTICTVSGNSPTPGGTINVGIVVVDRGVPGSTPTAV